MENFKLNASAKILGQDIVNIIETDPLFIKRTAAQSNLLNTLWQSLEILHHGWELHVDKYVYDKLFQQSIIDLANNVHHNIKRSDGTRIHVEPQFLIAVELNFMCGAYATLINFLDYLIKVKRAPNSGKESIQEWQNECAVSEYRELSFHLDYGNTRHICHRSDRDLLVNLKYPLQVKFDEAQKANINIEWELANLAQGIMKGYNLHLDYFNKAIIAIKKSPQPRFTFRSSMKPAYTLLYNQLVKTMFNYEITDSTKPHLRLKLYEYVSNMINNFSDPTEYH